MKIDEALSILHRCQIPELLQLNDHDAILLLLAFFYSVDR